ncbi:efflux RND transporter periplasmic adaptor subunit [Caulobacter segnis]
MVAATAALAGCGDKPKAEEPLAPTPVEAARVAAPGAAGSVTGAGTLERRREMALSFRIPGVLTAMRVEAGDRIRAPGQAIAAIDPAGVDARQQQTAADLERARRDVERDRALFDKGYVSRQRLDDRTSALKAAQASYDAARFDRRWASLVSPVSGVVLERRAQAGEVVAAGQVVARVADLSSPLVLRLPLAAREGGSGPGRRRGPGDSRGSPGNQALAGRVTRVGEAAEHPHGAPSPSRSSWLLRRPPCAAARWLTPPCRFAPRRARPPSTPASRPRRCWRPMAGAASSTASTTARPAARP